MPVFTPRTPPLPDGFTSRPRGELLAVAFERVRLNRGTNYPCDERALRLAQTLDGHPRSSRDYVSADQASCDIWAHNALGRNLGQSEYNAISRLESVILAVFANRLTWWPDLIIKAFCDLDRVFFLGKLREHVHVRWRSGSSFPRPHSGTFTFGRTDPLGGGKAAINLNADAIFANNGLNTFKEMWRTMLHEMCHAYEITQVAEQNRERNRHGSHFGTKVRAVHERARREIHVGAMHSGEHYNRYTFSSSRRR